MTEQPDLFGTPEPPRRQRADRAFARAGDPLTSHKAAAEVTPKVTKLEADVLASVRSAGVSGRTLDEVCDDTGIDKVTASPRFKPLERKGLIQRSGTRQGKAGKQQTVWFVPANLSRILVVCGAPNQA